LLWLHSFEEPFLNAEEMDALGRRTDFVVEGTRFTGALCCLVLRKAAASVTNTEAEGQPGHGSDVLTHAAHARRYT
ncbi:MAG: hypothetical protein ABIK91_00580, partial [Pseudomonadota bacterium]